MYRGIPTIKLNGNVIPSEAVTYMPGLASGSAMRIAAGAAMYEALAASVAITATPPTDMPAAEPSTAPTEPSTFWWFDFGDSHLCQRRNERGINFPVEWNLKREFVDCVRLELFQVRVKGINAKRVDRDVVFGD